VNSEEEDEDELNREVTKEGSSHGENEVLSSKITMQQHTTSVN
jgi:hypothetical protein